MALGSSSRKIEENRKENQEGKKPLEPIGFLWLRFSKNGDKYYEGNINGQDVLIFKNKSTFNNKGDLTIFKKS